MKKILLFILFHFSFVSIGQKKNESYKLTERNKILLKKLKKSSLEREKRILNFISKKTNTKRSYRNGKGNLFVIKDIINNKPIYITNDNQKAAKATKTVNLHSGGSLNLNLDGTGINIGVWDGGPVQDNHQEFANSSSTNFRVKNFDTTTVDGKTEFSDHATHVAGTIGAKGVELEAKGMAPNINIKSYNWTNDVTEMLLAVNDINSPIIISNHSYGVSVISDSGPISSWIMGSYNQDAREIDEIAANNPKYLIVASAGNAGNDSYNGGLFSGFDKLTTDKNAKNNLVVANANPTFNPFNNELVLTINPTSSQGPTDDLRIKPDLAGDGTNLYSPVPLNNYQTFSGTSMASPNVAGSLALIQEYYHKIYNTFMNSSTLKGLACHTAIDDSNLGPDPIFGWGFLDTSAAVSLIIDKNAGTSIIEELTLNNNEKYTTDFNIQGSDQKLIATICWTDVPGSASVNDLNNQTPKLVNDLDLRLTKNGETFYPWKLNYSNSTGFSNSKGDNNVDNIEKIEIDVPTPGLYTLTVTHKGSIKETAPFKPKSQNFSLIISGSKLTLNSNDYEKSNISIFPNPTSSYINLSLLTKKINRVALFDSLGKEINIKLKQNRIDISHLSDGVYFIKVYDNDNNVHIKKIIKN